MTLFLKQRVLLWIRLKRVSLFTTDKNGVSSREGSRAATRLMPKREPLLGSTRRPVDAWSFLARPFPDLRYSGFPCTTCCSRDAFYTVCTIHFYLTTVLHKGSYTVRTGVRWCEVRRSPTQSDGSLLVPLEVHYATMTVGKSPGNFSVRSCVLKSCLWRYCTDSWSQSSIREHHTEWTRG